MSAHLSPIDASQWNRAAARHLLNRAGFGVPYERINQVFALGAEKAVDAFVNFDRVPDNITEPDWLSDPATLYGARERKEEMDPEEAKMRRDEERRAQRTQVGRLQSWWLNQMRRTNRPLQEKLALFWHGHFATSAQKVQPSAHNYQLNAVFRQNAAGNFKALVFEVGKSPAMMRYLDNAQNKKGKPNENWARELMELFTMGIGNYTEEDIKEGARAFSGYTLSRAGEFQFNKKQHDPGPKVFLGRSGEFDGADVINIIFEQPVTARFISAKLWTYFAGTHPDEALTEELAAVFRESNYELKPLLRTMFLSKEFHSEKIRAAQVKSPAQFIVMFLEDLDVNPRREEPVRLAMRALGQELFFPPNVKGWEGNRAWINTNTLLTRYNIPAYVLKGERPSFEGAARRSDAEVAAMAGMTEPKPKRGGGGMERAFSGAGVRPEDLLRPYAGKTMGELVLALQDRFLSRPFDDEQRASLLKALDDKGTADTIFDPARVPAERCAALLHLTLSTAEYQLC